MARPGDDEPGRRPRAGEARRAGSSAASTQPATDHVRVVRRHLREHRGREGRRARPRRRRAGREVGTVRAMPATATAPSTANGSWARSTIASLPTSRYGPGEQQLGIRRVVRAADAEGSVGRDRGVLQPGGHRSSGGRCSRRRRRAGARARPAPARRARLRRARRAPPPTAPAAPRRRGAAAAGRAAAAARRRWRPRPTRPAARARRRGAAGRRHRRRACRPWRRPRPRRPRSPPGRARAPA